MAQDGLALKPTIVYDTYWRFAGARQEAYVQRLRGLPPPWTSDPILTRFKFTNAYRAADRVSQYLIRNVIYREDLPNTPEELCFRILVFKIFNKIETWQALETGLSAVVLDGFSVERYSNLLSRLIESGQSIYSGAYIMPSGGKGARLQRKHEFHLRLIARMLSDSLPAKLADARSMHDAFGLLKAYPSIGDFLAYQYVTDINYSNVTDFSESEFVMPGPGALDGIRKCFRDLAGQTESNAIRIIADRQEYEFERLGVAFPSLWGRRLQLIDCQNLFCEVDKYSRVRHPEVSGISGRKRIKQRFAPRTTITRPWFPPKWGINDAIADWYDQLAVQRSTIS